MPTRSRWSRVARTNSAPPPTAWAHAGRAGRLSLGDLLADTYAMGVQYRRVVRETAPVLGLEAHPTVRETMLVEYRFDLGEKTITLGRCE